MTYNNFQPTNWHADYDMANKTCYWHGTDTYETWVNNYADYERRRFFIENKWDTKTSISYNFNSAGFRCDEFNDDAVYIALGDSITMGVGINSEHTWCSVLSEYISVPVLNLGVGGAGMDTCFRILHYYINILNVQGVFLLSPNIVRCERFVSTYPRIFSPAKSDTAYLQWAVEDGNIYYTTIKNHYALRYLCNRHNIKLISIDEYDASRYGLGRDLVHPGIQGHQYVADSFMQKVKNG